MRSSPDTETMIQLARDAAREIMMVYASDFAVRNKSDLTPVTEADERAEKVIVAGLRRAFPDVGIVAEEAMAAGGRAEIGEAFFLVDPLDGTKEFLSRNGEFTVNIALVKDGRAVAGVVYAPANGELYWGEIGTGAGFCLCPPDQPGAIETWTPIRVRKAPADGLTVLASRSHRDAATEDYLKTVPVKELISAGSSLKFCRIAKGNADLYPRFGRTMEWDTAAGQAVLEAAGGHVVQQDGAPLRYGKRERGFDNPGFVASGAAA